MVNNEVYSVLNGMDVVAVVCNQWGDTGKGKFVDLYADWADIIARGTGGNNAGHTIVLNGKQYIQHLIPSGILKDGDGKINVMGSGMVDDLGVIVKELDELEANGYSYNGLRISDRAQVILPHHKMIDSGLSSMDKGNIGTTGRGIGPAYSDKVARFGITVGDLRDKDNFFKKLKRTLDHHHYLEGLNMEEIIETELKHFQRIKDFVCDTDVLVRKAVHEGKKVLAEGAQGLLLSIDYGTLPYVTSSDPSVYGLSKGIGLLPENIDLTLGIVKFPFMTRVGNGPFPTEYGGRLSEEYCAKDNGNANKRLVEEKKFNNFANLMNSSYDFEKGVGIRMAAGEYGATTERPRRTGRTDLVALKHAMKINEKDIILTKADCVYGMESIELGIGYLDESGKGSVITEINHGSDIRYGLEGVYKHFDGYHDDISGCETFDELPNNLRNPIEFLQNYTGARVRVVSVGAEADQTVVKG